VRQIEHYCSGVSCQMLALPYFNRRARTFPNPYHRACKDSRALMMGGSGKHKYMFSLPVLYAPGGAAKLV